MCLLRGQGPHKMMWRGRLWPRGMWIAAWRGREPVVNIQTNRKWGAWVPFCCWTHGERLTVQSSSSFHLMSTKIIFIRESSHMYSYVSVNSSLVWVQYFWWWLVYWVYNFFGGWSIGASVNCIYCFIFYYIHWHRSSLFVP